MIKLVYPFSGVAGIHFPVGRLSDGGTCEFASEKCLKECAAFKNVTDINKIDYGDKCKTFEYITQGESKGIIWEIAKQVKEMETEILYWFASGDCSRKHTEKIAYIIKGLSFIIPVQIGFTRNKKLWKKVNEFKLDNVKIALTVESPYKSKIQQLTSSGMVVVPNYDTGFIDLYLCNQSYGSCGGSIVYLKRLDKIEEKKADCSNCYKEKIGCFKDI